MIESLINIRDARKRFPDLPVDHVEHLCYIHTLIFNGAPWDKVVQRREITYLELGMLLMPLDAEEIKELQDQGEINWDVFVEQERKDLAAQRFYREHPREIRWPMPDPDALIGVTKTIAIQVNGRLRGTVEAPSNALEQTVEQLAYQDDRIKAHLDDKQITRKVFVEGRVLNFVVQDSMG